MLVRHEGANYQRVKFPSGSIRTKKGCRQCDFCGSMEDENRLFLFEEWDTREDFDRYQKSEGFKAFRGAMNRLHEPCEMMFNTVAGSHALSGTEPYFYQKT